MQIRIIGTGSSGNSFLFNDDLIIDVGLSFKDMKNAIDLKKVKYVLLTHIHGDHLSLDALRKIVVRYDVKIICGKFLLQTLLKNGHDRDNIIVVSASKMYKIGQYKISPVIAYHDVDNFGYRIIQDGYKHFHITDTSTLDGITAKNYDSATIECNHDLQTLLKLVEEAKNNDEFTHLVGAKNSHLSVQQTVKFVKENNIKKLYPVHIGDSTRTEVLKCLSSLTKRTD